MAGPWGVTQPPRAPSTVESGQNQSWVASWPRRTWMHVFGYVLFMYLLVASLLAVCNFTVKFCFPLGGEERTACCLWSCTSAQLLAVSFLSNTQLVGGGKLLIGWRRPGGWGARGWQYSLPVRHHCLFSCIHDQYIHDPTVLWDTVVTSCHTLLQTRLVPGRVIF